MIWEIDDRKREIEGIDALGRPDPAYAAALGMLRAPFGRRALAFGSDIAIWLVLQLPMWIGAVPLLMKLATGSISPYGFLNHPGFVLAVVMAAASTLLSLIYCVVQWIMHGIKGMTIGKAIAGIRTVNVRTLVRPGVWPVLLRFLIVYVSGIVPLLPIAFLASPTFDPEKRGRGWHDKASKLWLIDVREGLNPFDEKRMRVARKMVKAEPAPERRELPSLATPSHASEQPAYRPGARVSAGVLGVARPHVSDARPSVGLSQAGVPSMQVGPGEAGKPVLGGYRARGDLETPGPAPVITEGLVTGVPVAPSVAPTQHPSPPAVAPQPQQAPVPQPQQAPAPQPAAEPQSQSQPAPAPQAEPVPAPQAEPAAAPQPAPTPTSRAQAAARFGLRLDNGESILVSEPVLLGRNPDAAGHPGARPVPLADDSRSLSKTHMFVRPVDGGLEIVDCNSTNGSGLVRDGVEYAVTAGMPILTVSGDLIRLGDRTAVVFPL